MRRKLIGGAVLAAGLVAIAVIVLQARADDAVHTTSLSFGSKVFPPSTTAEPAILASITSTDPTDAKWLITLFATPPGGTETKLSRSWTLRSEGETSGCSSARNYGDLSSGTQIRALFQTKDTLGGVVFSHNRYLTVP